MGILFDVNIRFQTASMIILLLITADYLRNPHLKLLSTKSFMILLWITGANLVFDVATVYTITHLSIVPPAINRLMHQLFIASIIAAIFANYIYVLMLSRNQKRLSRGHLIFSIAPLVVSAFVVLFGKLKYHVAEDSAYSYGSMVTMIYICGVFYLILTVILSVRRDTCLDHNQRVSVRVGLALWLTAMLIQFFFPHLLISGFGLTLLVLSVYFSFENQKENYDPETHCFSRTAFHRVMDENYEKKQPLCLINAVCINHSHISSTLGHDMGYSAIASAADIISKTAKLPVFHSRANCLSIFFEGSEENAAKLAKKLETDLWEIKFTQISPDFRVNVVDLRKYAETSDEACSFITFMIGESLYADKNVIVLNEKIASKKHRRDRIEKLVADAVENNGFEMYYQPIFSTEKGTFHSAEALIRMRSTSELGYISPEEFIPIAEEKGMIFDIGDAVVEQVAEFAKRSEVVSQKLDFIEVNLSGLQAASPDLDKRLEQILRKYGISPSFINLEITETAVIGSEDVFSENISSLRRIGFSFSMDDFGTGYSNLSQITKINYDLVKIDKSLIWPAFGENRSEKAEKLLSSVISMLKAIGAKIVAEGIETEEMAEYLTDKGVDYLQGYFFSKPVPEDTFVEILRSAE